MAAPIVSIRGLRFRYPGGEGDVLRIETLDVGAGEHLFVKGPSGCGKSTLLALVAGVLVASEGVVALDGHDWSRRSAAARDRLRADRIGYVFQQFNLLPYLSVIDNVLLPCRFSRKRALQAAAGGGDPAVRAGELLARMGIDAGLQRRAASTLSVGQQQRVAAARALIGLPALVIADEPTSALDEAMRSAFMATLLEACAEAGSALLFVSHDERLAERFGRRFALGGCGRASRHAAEAAA